MEEAAAVVLSRHLARPRQLWRTGPTRWGGKCSSRWWPPAAAAAAAAAAPDGDGSPRQTHTAAGSG